MSKIPAESFIVGSRKAEGVIMHHDIYQFPTLPGDSKATLEEMRKIIATDTPMGITLTGNRLTLRFGGKKMKTVHMVILEVDDGEPEPEEENK